MTINLPIPSRASLRKHISLTVGAIMLVTGLTLYFVDTNIRENLCDKGQSDFVSKLEPSISLVCKFQGEIFAQDLTLRSIFFEVTGKNTTTVTFPANAQIVDPNGVVLKNVNFFDNVTISVKPETKGDYKAILTFLDKGDKKYDPEHKIVGMEFGFSLRGSLFDRTTAMLKPVGKFLSFSSAIFLGYGGLQIFLDKRKRSA